MTDAISVLEQTNKKLATKVEKLRAQLAAAETELAEGETAVRVLKKLGLSPTVEGVSEEGKQSSRAQVLSVLPMEETLSLTPNEVHQALVKDGSLVSPDNVRTILSRLKRDGEVQVAEGRYWRQLQREPASSFDDDDFDDFSGVQVRSRLTADDGSDIPF